MNILIVAPTQQELLPLKTKIEDIQFSGKNTYFFLVSGIGISNSTFNVTQALLSNHYDFVIQIGVAGSFSAEVSVGNIVWITEDCFSDFGADTADGFLSMKELNLISENPEEKFILSLAKEIPLPNSLMRVKGITADIIHNNPVRISALLKKHSPDVESMEGAAIMHVCNQLKVPNIQVRAISNWVAPRDSSGWNFDLATDALTKWGFDYINMLEL